MERTDTQGGVAPQAGGGGPSAGTAAPERPNGPVAAVMFATGIGGFVLGLFTVLGEASEGVHDFLEWSERVGPLSGVTSLAVIAFLLSWGALYGVLRDRDLPWRPVIITTVALLAIAVVFTYPPFFELFKDE